MGGDKGKGAGRTKVRVEEGRQKEEKEEKDGGRWYTSTTPYKLQSPMTNLHAIVLNSFVF